MGGCGAQWPDHRALRLGQPSERLERAISPQRSSTTTGPATSGASWAASKQGLITTYPSEGRRRDDDPRRLRVHHLQRRGFPRREQRRHPGRPGPEGLRQLPPPARPRLRHCCVAPPAAVPRRSSTVAAGDLSSVTGPVLGNVMTVTWSSAPARSSRGSVIVDHRPAQRDGTVLAGQSADPAARRRGPGRRGPLSALQSAPAHDRRPSTITGRMGPADRGWHGRWSRVSPRGRGRS